MERARFRHQALIYEGEDQYLAGTVPFLWAALEAEEPVLVAVGMKRRRLLEEELGGDARWLHCVAIEEVGRNPAAIIPFWRNFVDENGGGPVRGISEPAYPGRSPAALEECLRHESLLNLAFAEEPAFSLLCPFDAATLPPHLVERVAGSHRHLLGDGRSEASLRFDPAPDCFAGELPPPASEPDFLGFGLAELPEVRVRVAAAAERAGLDPRGVADLVTAASELAANSVMHGGGSGLLRLWRENATLLTEVSDRGRIEEPLVGRLRPPVTQEGGRGLWLANQLCDLVQIRSGEEGTVVRLHVPAHDRPPGFEPPSPATDPRADGERLNA
jgi:anti-sigma regulatory factor (Ser/Thr protein kinase)